MNSYLKNIWSFVKAHFFVTAFVALLIFLTIGYWAGYRPGPSLTFVRTGTLVVQGLPQGAVVYVDETRRGVSTGQDMKLPLVPGNHSVIVDSGVAIFPWSDLVAIEASKKTVASPLLVLKETKKTMLSATDTVAVKTLLRNYSLPTTQAPISFSGGCVTVAVAENQILAVGSTSANCLPPAYLCTETSCLPTVIFSSPQKIHSVLPYPGREDALLVSYGGTVAVIELNPLEPQFRAPLYVGNSATVLPWSENSFAIVDETRAYQISL